MRLDRLYNLPNLRANIVKQKEAAMDKILEEEYGFKVDPSQPLRKGLRRIIANRSVREVMDKPRKLAYHNLCLTLKPPPGCKELLGLGPKFCIRPPYLNHRVDDTRAQMQKDVRNKFYWAKRREDDEEEEEEERQYEPKFYINSSWKPPE